MVPLSLILVLSQPEFIERQVRKVLGGKPRR
jgi:hypothetical protein